MVAKKNYFTVVGLVYGKGLTELAQFEDRKSADWHIKTTFAGLGYDKLLIKPTTKRNKDIIVTKRVADDKDTYVHAKVGMSVLDWEKLDIATEFGSLLKFTLPSSGVLTSIREIGKLSEVVADALDKDGNIEKVSTTIVQSENTPLPLTKAKEALTNGILGILLGSEDSVLEEVDLDEDEEIFEEEDIVEEEIEVLEVVTTVEEDVDEPISEEPVVEEVPEVLEEVAIVVEVVEPVVEEVKKPARKKKSEPKAEEVPEVLEEVATVEVVIEMQPVEPEVVEPTVEPVVEAVPEVLEEVATVDEVVEEQFEDFSEDSDLLDILDEEVTVSEPIMNEVSTISFNDLDDMDFDI